MSLTNWRKVSSMKKALVINSACMSSQIWLQIQLGVLGPHANQASPTPESGGEAVHYPETQTQTSEQLARRDNDGDKDFPHLLIDAAPSPRQIIKRKLLYLFPSCCATCDRKNNGNCSQCQFSCHLAPVTDAVSGYFHRLTYTSNAS